MCKSQTGLKTLLEKCAVSSKPIGARMRVLGGICMPGSYTPLALSERLVMPTEFWVLGAYPLPDGWLTGTQPTQFLNGHTSFPRRQKH